MFAGKLGHKLGASFPKVFCQEPMLPLRTLQFARLGCKNSNSAEKPHRAASQSDDADACVRSFKKAFVKSDVQLRVVFEFGAGRDDSIEFCNASIHCIGIGRCHPLGGEMTSTCLEHRTHLEDVLDLIDIQGRDIKATARLELDQPFGRKPVQRLADRQPADAEPARDLLLAQRLPRVQLAGKNYLAQPVMGRLLQR